MEYSFSLTRDEYIDILRKVHETKELRYPDEKPLLDLLHNLFILQYPNGPGGMELIPLSTSSSESERKPITATLLSDADRRAVAEIAATLDASKHGCIYFGVCNNRLKIEAVEAALEEALSTHGMGVERVVLAERDTGTEPPTYRVHITEPVRLPRHTAAPPAAALFHSRPAGPDSRANRRR